MAEAARLKALRRAVAQQTILRERALATRAAVTATIRGMSVRQSEMLRALDTDATGAVQVLIMAGVARRLEDLAREAASLEARAATLDAKAARHGRLARAGELRGARLAEAAHREAARAELDALIELRVARAFAAIQDGPGQADASLPP